MSRVLSAMRPITIGMVFASAYVIGRTAVTGPLTLGVFVSVLALLGFTRVPILAVLAAAAAAGWLAA